MNLVKQVITQALHHKVSRLDALYQRHVGQECYIFGDGTSLKWMDLHQFSDKISIIGNMIIYHKDVEALHIPYCAIIEPFWFWPIFPYRRSGRLHLFKHRLHREYRKSIVQHPDTQFFINISNYPVARFPNALYISRWYCPPFENNNPFKERRDAHQGTFKFQVALAIYLGFKKAYLIGHDYTHAPSRSLHFYEKGDGVLDGNKDFCRTFIDYAKQHIDLVTVILDGGSETMTSVKYQDFTGKKPRFRENIEIVGREKLESLAQWHGYSIF